MAIEIPTNLTEAREKIAQANLELAKRREQSREQNGMIAQLENALARTQQTALSVISKAPKVVGPAVEVAVTVGSAYVGGYAQEYLTEKNSDKIGPLPAVPTIGVVIAGGALLWADNPDIQAAGLAVGTGLAAVGAADMGKKARKAHKTALDEMAAKAGSKKAAA